MISNCYFNHSRTTSLQYGLAKEPGGALFVQSKGGIQLRVHPRTLESAFEWSMTIEKALDNGVNSLYLVNENYVSPTPDMTGLYQGLLLPELTLNMIQRALQSLGLEQLLHTQFTWSN